MKGDGEDSVCSGVLVHGDNDKALTFDLSTYVPGHILTFDVIGSRVNANRVEGLGDADTYYISIVGVKNGETTIDLGNFDFETDSDNEATLTVEPRNIVLNVTDSSKVYDGIALDRNYSLTMKGSGENSVCSGVLVHGDNDKALTFDLSTYVPGHILTFNVVGVRVNVNGAVIEGYIDDDTYSIEVVGVKNGDITVDIGNFEFDTTNNEGELNVAPRHIKITTNSSEKIYDGITLVDHRKDGVYAEEMRDGDRGLLDSIHTLEVTFVGTVTNVGTVDNSVTIKITDTVSEIDVTANYVLDTDGFGTLKITKREISVTPDNNEKIYDSEMLKSESFTVVEIDNEGNPITNVCPIVDGVGEFTLVTTGEKLVITVVGGRINVVAAGSDTEKSTISAWSINDIDSNGNYDAAIGEGTLNVIPKDITIETGSKVFLYDGKKHYCTDFTVSGLVDGHKLVVISSTEIRNVGTVDNEFTSIGFVDASENVIADTNYNYADSITCGTLEVTPLRVVITTADKESIYTGSPLTYNKYTITAYNDLGNKLWTRTYTNAEAMSISETGDSIVLVTSGSVTNVFDDNNGVAGNNTVGSVVFTYGGEDVTANYAYEFGTLGTLTVKPIKISLEAGTDSKQYDATPLTCGKFTVTVDGKMQTSNANGECVIISGDVITVDIVGSVTNLFDTSENVITNVYVNGVLVAVEGESGDEATTNYIVTKLKDGKLTITPREISILFTNQEKVYDGTDFDLSAIETEITGFLPGHSFAEGTFELTLHGSQITAGSSDLTCSVADGWVIVDGEGNDVSQNYLIPCKEKKQLKVTQRPISIETPSGSKIYDGMPLYNDKITVEEEKEGSGLLSSESLTLLLWSSLTDVGKIKNEVTVEIRDALGNVVTDSYKLDFALGNLEVTKRSITVTSGSFNKVADGDALLYPNVEIEGLPDGFDLEVEVTGSQSGLGSSVNSMDKSTLVITNGEGFTVDEGNFEIEWIEGELTIEYSNDSSLNPGLDLSGAGGSGSQLGLPEDITSPSDLDKGPLYELNFGETTATRLYFKQASFGVYNGNSWGSAPEYEMYMEIDGKSYSMSYLAALIMAENGYDAFEVEITPVIKNYIAAYYASILSGEAQQSDVYVQGSASEKYTLQYYANIDWINLSVSDGYALYEQMYGEFVRENYLDIPESTYDYLIEYMKEKGIISADYDASKVLTRDEIVSVCASIARYLQTTEDVSYSLEYNRELDSAEDVAIAFLSGTYGGEGVCQHYATVGTLMFRALGIPARYTVGYAADATEDTYTITGKDAHAWVEIYVDGIGWQYVEVTGSALYGSGGSGITGTPDGCKGIITIVPQDSTKPYDGSPLMADKFVITSTSFNFNDSERYNVEVTFGGSQIEYGVGESEITDVKITDIVTGEVIYHFSEGIGSNIMHLVTGVGKLEVKRAVYIELGYKDSQRYNGKEITYDSEGDADIWFVSCFNGKGEYDYDIGEYDRDNNWFIPAEDGGWLKVSLKFHFSLGPDVGKISIKYVNENWLSIVQKFEVTHFDSVDYDNEGCIYGIGAGTDVTDLYAPAFCDDYGNSASDEYNPLAISHVTLNVISGSGKTEYDSIYETIPFVCESFEYSFSDHDESFSADDYKVEVIMSGSLDKVGVAANKVESIKVIRRSDEVDVTDNFTFNITEGMLEIYEPQS